MVQEKDAARKRVERREAMRRDDEQRLKNNTIKFEWCVIEHTPGYNTGGYYDTDVPAKNVVVSPYFGTEKEATMWMNAHEPDKGNSLHVKRRRLLKRTWTEWVWY